MKFYFAGKIGADDWRHSIVQDLDGAGDGPPSSMLDGGKILCLPESWPILPGSVLIQHDYVGPFFLSGYDYNHSSMSTHGPHQHGNAIIDVSSGVAESGAVDPATFDFMSSNHYAVSDDDTREHIIKLCLRAITQCDVVFAWIDSMTAYGTLTELGFARAYRKPIWWAQPMKPYDAPSKDLWFARHLAERHEYAPTALAAIQSFLNPRWQQPDGYVYLLESGGFIKIGKSKKVDQRVTQISPKTPMPVKHIHTIESNDMTWAERMLHQRYAQFRTNGEWFSLSKKEVAALLRVTHLARP